MGHTSFRERVVRLDAPTPAEPMAKPRLSYKVPRYSALVVGATLAIVSVLTIKRSLGIGTASDLILYWHWLVRPDLTTFLLFGWPGLMCILSVPLTLYWPLGRSAPWVCQCIVLQGFFFAVWLGSGYLFLQTG